MTSNIGTRSIGDEKTVGFDPELHEASYDTMKKKIYKELKRLFNPELVNRIDETIVFRALDNDDIRQIVRLQFARLQKLLADSGFEAELSEAALDHLAKVGYDPTYGARPIKRLVNKELSQRIAKKMLTGEIKPDSKVKIDYIDNDIRITAVVKETVEISTK